MTEAKNKEKKKKRGFIAVIILLIAIVAVLLVYICVLQPQQEEKDQERQLAAERNAELGILPGMDEEDIQRRLNEKVAEGMLNISVNPNPVFADGKSEGNLRIENIPGNNYAITVELIRDDNGETVYTSGLIDPGYFVENVTLDKDLAAGEYPALAKFTAYDPSTKLEIGTAGARINILVLN